ncbi:hypothetical protein CYMTET_31213 [Cymbomonas tetramitiformis]|uniref:phosphoethanolamine N-methyltransferase n=1 Tax=Cymbomonas tetramitiformis TaxID=36881 RepID=A0AAE0FHF3_9CHLO|nr:hypothetical protein CYMTET_31213 [Cymbomonas tetramitiformis]
MGIYIDGRVGNELREMLSCRGGWDGITVEDVHSCTQMHYLGKEPIEKAAEFFNLHVENPHRVLDFGAGFAGDSRVLAARYGCHVSCVDIQPHVHDTAEKLTRELKMEDRVSHVCIDSEQVIPGAPFDHMLSILVILHIPNRPEAFSRVATALKPSATIFIEDFFKRNEFSDSELQDLATTVACPGPLPSKEQYIQELTEAGFCDIQFEEMHDRWLPFLIERKKIFTSEMARHERVHGTKMTEELLHFYSTVLRIFEDGNLGGARICARKA